MVLEKTGKPDPLARYETLRRKEFERLSALLDTLGKVDGLPIHQMDQARDALFHTDHPYLVVLLGAFNTGKSTLINALIGEPVLAVGATPTTQQIAILRHGPALQRTQAGEVQTIFHPAPLLERLSLVDTPGLESVFRDHEEVTRRFLHRADIVWLVMLATQAMSARNVEYLGSLRAYGKRIIILINETDLLETEDRNTLKAFVAEQVKLNLGLTPEIWMVSAKLAQDARRAKTENPALPAEEWTALWQASGFDQIDQFVSRALSDAERVRAKLETPLQIARNVLTLAIGLVREQQDALSEHRRAAQNVQGQIEAALREQAATVKQTIDEIDTAFAEAIRRGREAIRDVFRGSRALSLSFGGVLELTRLSRLLQRFGAQTLAQKAFEQRLVNEPLNQIPAIADRLGPRLEGRDVKDVENLVAYARREVERLPESLQQKLVGKLEVPSGYDRSAIRSARDGLMAELDQARSVEFKRIDSAVRNSITLLGLYEFFVLVGALCGAIASIGSQDGGWALLLVLIVLVLGLAGLALAPLRGLLMERAYADRMFALKTDFEKDLEHAAQQQIDFGRQMRQNAAAPFMRLVEAQIEQSDQLKRELDEHAQALISLEKELGTIRS